MAETARRNSASPPPRKAITAENVREIVDGLVPNFPDAADPSVLRPRYDLLAPEFQIFCKRLRDDPDGRVSAALNQLRSHVAEDVLVALRAAVIDAQIVNSLGAIRAKEKELRRHADGLCEAAAKIEAGCPRDSAPPLAREMRLFAANELRYADALAAAPARVGASRKHAGKGAIIDAAVRNLARRIFGEGRVRHAAIAFLLSAAGGEAVSERVVRDALRSTVRTNTRSPRKSIRERVSLSKMQL
jgi:hypothetical protein